MKGRSLYAVLLPTLECQMECAYCFAQPHPGRWSVQATTDLVDAIVEMAGARECERLCLHWQGGEPLLMGRAYWERVLAHARERAARAGVALEQTMQTNLLLWDDWVADLARENLGSRIGTSFEPHAGRRLPGDADGARFRRLWQEAHGRATDGGIEVGVLSLVTPEALDIGASEHLTTLRDDHGVRALRPTLPLATSDGRGLWIDPEGAGRFLADAHAWWVDQGRDEGVRIRPFAFLEALVAGRSPSEPGLCFFSPCCAENGFAVTPSGDVHLCDNVATDPAWRPWGNAFESPLADLLEGPRWRETCRRVRDLLTDECLGCRWLPVCRGGCLARSGPGSTPHFRYCASYIRLLEAIESRISRTGSRSG